MGVVDLLGIISFFLLSLVVRKLVVGYLKDTNAGEWRAARRRRRRPLALSLFFLSPKMKFGRVELISSIVSSFKGLLE